MGNMMKYSVGFVSLLHGCFIWRVPLGLARALYWPLGFYLDWSGRTLKSFGSGVIKILLKSSKSNSNFQD
jgi:hypothetical protein